MTFRKAVAYTVAASLVITLLPAGAFAADDGSAVKTPAPVTKTAPASIDFRAAARDVARTAVQPTSTKKTLKDSNESPRMQGGGGKGGMIVGLVSAAVGIGMGYFMYKQLKKTTDSVTTQPTGGQ
jgi:hypothetical protein